MYMPGFQLGGISLIIHILINLFAKLYQKIPRPSRLGAR